MQLIHQSTTPYNPLTISGLGVNILCNHISHYELEGLSNKILDFFTNISQMAKWSFDHLSQSQTSTFQIKS